MPNNTDAIISEMRKAFAKVTRGSKGVTVGIHEDAGMHPDSTITNAQIGALLNYGTDKIQPRAWLIPGVKSAEQDMKDTVAHGLESGESVERIIQQVGVVAAGAVQQYMTDLQYPPNAPSTIAQKGSSNPLIDSGALRASVSWKVDKE